MDVSFYNFLVLNGEQLSLIASEMSPFPFGTIVTTTAAKETRLIATYSVSRVAMAIITPCLPHHKCSILRWRRRHTAAAFMKYRLRFRLRLSLLTHAVLH